MTLGSELALLHVARGESIALVVLLFVGFVRTLYTEEAGTFVRTGCRLSCTLRLISMCLIAISKDFFESVLPKPKLSEDKDFPSGFFRVEGSYCFGGANFLWFTTLSTLWVPISTGFTSSLSLEDDLLMTR